MLDSNLNQAASKCCS